MYSSAPPPPAKPRSATHQETIKVLQRARELSARTAATFAKHSRREDLETIAAALAEVEVDLEQCRVVAREALGDRIGENVRALKQIRNGLAKIIRDREP